MQWIQLSPAHKIPLDGYQTFEVDSVSVLVVNKEGRFFAVENVCTHDGGDLEGAEIEGEEVICPRHGAGFCIKSGEVTRPPAYEGIKSFPVEVRAGYLYIQI